MTENAPDKILSYLGETKGWHDIATIAKRTGYGVNDVLRVLPKLVREHYVEERFAEKREQDRVYSISYDGIEFLKKGGYAGQSNEPRLRTPGPGSNSGKEHKLAAIMFTDIVGYTRIMGTNEQRALAMLERNRAVQLPLIERYTGRFIKEIGDAIMSSFTSASDAVNCAVAIQQSVEDDPELSLRIGIDLDEVFFEANDAFGDGVNVAARIQSAGKPGAILISDSVYRTVHNKAGISTRFVQRMELRNVDRPIDIHEVAVNGTYSAAVETSPSLSKSETPETLFPGVWELEYDHHGTGNFGYDPWIKIKNVNEYHTSGSKAFLLEDLSVDPLTKTIRFVKVDPASGNHLARNVLRIVRPYELYEGQEEGITPVTYYKFPRRFGKWVVEELGIAWTGGPEYMISASRLLEARPGPKGLVYDWLIHMPEKTWLSNGDILDLNEAFQFGLRRFGLDKKTTISMDETLSLQRGYLKDRT